MMFIPQPSRAPHLLPLFISAALCIGLSGPGCSFSDSDPGTAARSIGQADVPARDLELTANAGTFRQISDERVVIRSAAPVIRVGIQGGDEASGAFTVHIDNVHPATRVRVLSVSFPDSSEVQGCPMADRQAIPCADAEAAIGDPCAAPTDCVAGLTCSDSTCQPASSFTFCTPPRSIRNPERNTSLELSLDVQPCTSIQYGIELTEEEASSALRFAAIGSTDSLEKLAKALDAVREGGEVDFVTVLGENAEDGSQEGIDALDQVFQESGVPIVYVAGSEAVSFDDGAYTLRQLGPHDQAFSLKGVRFTTFFSAERELGNRGLQRLETFLRQLERLGSGPIVALTHTVPIDPNGVRNQGFKNRTEGARTLSLLDEFGVDYLLSGGLPANESDTISDIEVWITSAEDTLIRQNSEYLELTAPEQESRTIEVRPVSF